MKANLSIDFETWQDLLFLMEAIEKEIQCKIQEQMMGTRKSVIEESEK